MDPTLEDISMILGDAEATGILEALAKLDGSQNAGCNTVTMPPQHMLSAAAPAPAPAVKDLAQKTAIQAAPAPPAAPFYFYKDFSTFEDPDSSIPVTQPGRIPNFPAKMYAILSRSDLSDIVSWLPHGRSWKVHKPREFEVKVIPTYFEHSKFSSFIRQANGWGFRRLVSKGPDRNSYYHEIFLRGMPHLLKIMKRPTASTKPVANASTEPDLHGISAERPLPEIKADKEVTDHVLQHCTFVERQQMYPGRLITDDQLKPAAVDYAAAAHFEPYRFFLQQPTHQQQHLDVPCATTLYHQAHPPPPAPVKAQPYLPPPPQAAPLHHEHHPAPVQTQCYLLQPPQAAPVQHEHHPAPVQTQSYLPPLPQAAPVHHDHHPTPVHTQSYPPRAAPVHHEHHPASVQTQSYLPQAAPVHHEHHPTPVHTQSYLPPPPQAAPVHHEHHPAPVQTQSYPPQAAPVHHEHHPAPVQTQSYPPQAAPVHHEHHPAPVQTQSYPPQAAPVHHEHHPAPVQTQSYLPSPPQAAPVHQNCAPAVAPQEAPLLHPVGCSFEISHLDPLLFHEEASKGFFDDPFVGGLTANEFW